MSEAARIFRPAAIIRSSRSHLGSVGSGPEPGLWLPILLLCAVVGAALYFLTTTTYTRKESVRGHLRHAISASDVVTSKSGIVQAVHVTNGEAVSRGQVLVTMVVNRATADGLDLTGLQLRELAAEKARLEEQLARTKDTERLELDALARRRAALTKVTEMSAQQQALARERYRIFLERLRTAESLRASGHLTREEWRSHRFQHLEEQQLLRQATSQVVEAAEQLHQVETQIERLAATTQDTIARFRANLSRLYRERLALVAAASHQTTAPMDGIVSALRVHEGQHLRRHQPQLTIVPTEMPLIAELLIPTRAAGFVQRGDPVRLRLEAFPHISFGTQAGEVVAVNDTVLAPGERSGPLLVSEPVFAAQVALARQTVRAYGQELPLRAGLLFDADLILEQRSLGDQLMGPILELRGRL